MRKRRFLNSVLVPGSDNINDFPASVWRDAKYDEIRAEMNVRLAVITESLQEEEDAVVSGREPTPAKVDAIKTARDTVRMKAKAVKVALDARGDDNEAIHGFNVKEEFDKP